MGKISRNIIRGWAANPQSESLVTVSLYINDILLDSTLAADLRKVIKMKNLHPTGKCGFQFKLNLQQTLTNNDTVKVVIGDQGIELQGSPQKFIDGDMPDSVSPLRRPSLNKPKKAAPPKKHVNPSNIFGIIDNVSTIFQGKSRKIGAFNFINRSKKIIMGWSPKSGCTGANKMFFDSAGCLEDALTYGNWIHNYDRVYIDQNPLRLKDMQRNDYFKFKIVRDLYKRVISSYAHAMFTKYASADINSVVKNVNADDLTFLQFLDYLEQINLTRTNPHHGLQKLVNAGEGSEYEYDFICKLETLDAGVKFINENSTAAFNLNLPKNRLETRHHVIKNKSFNDIAYDKPFWKIASNDKVRKLPDFRFFYNAEIIERVTKLYKEDIDEYGYSYSMAD